MSAMEYSPPSSQEGMDNADDRNTNDDNGAGFAVGDAESGEPMSAATLSSFPRQDTGIRRCCSWQKEIKILSAVLFATGAFESFRSIGSMTSDMCCFSPDGFHGQWQINKDGIMAAHAVYGLLDLLISCLACAVAVLGFKYNTTARWAKAHRLGVIAVGVSWVCLDFIVQVQVSMWDKKKYQHVTWVTEDGVFEVDEINVFSYAVKHTWMELLFWVMYCSRVHYLHDDGQQQKYATIEMAEPTDGNSGSQEYLPLSDEEGHSTHM